MQVEEICVNSFFFRLMFSSSEESIKLMLALFRSELVWSTSNCVVFCFVLYELNTKVLNYIERLSCRVLHNTLN